MLDIKLRELWGEYFWTAKKQVKILGEEINVGAEIYDIEGFSGHADQNVLLDWINKFKKKPKKIFIVHGEEESATALSTLIEHLYKIETIIPNIGNSFNIDGDEVELTRSIEILPDVVRRDIENEFRIAYNQFEALIDKSSQMIDNKILIQRYDEIKNQLIDIQHRLMDLNIMIGR